MMINHARTSRVSQEQTVDGMASDGMASELRRSPELLDRHRSLLLIVDLQEKLVPVIPNAARVIDTSCFLLNVAEVLGVPVFVSEQYPAGLGPTVAAVREHLVAAQTFEKLRFSAAEEFAGRVQTLDTTNLRRQVVLAGIETHICVAQTALDLLARGFQVSVVQDGTGCRHEQDLQTAVDRLRDHGVTMTTAESVAFEWCEVAGSDEFKQVSRLVRQRDNNR